jgi:hypothetical protein
MLPDSCRDELTPIVGIRGSAMLVVWTLASKSADDPGDHVLCNAPSPLAQQHIVPCAGSSSYVAPYRVASAAPVLGGVKMSSAPDTIRTGAVSFVASTASD